MKPLQAFAFLLGFTLTSALLSCGHARGTFETDTAAARETMLDGYWLKARACAFAYATEKHRPINRIERPAVKIMSTEKEMLAIMAAERPLWEKPAPKTKGGKMVLCGLCSFRDKTIYVLGMDYETLAHEYGHWFFSNNCDVAEDFAQYMVKWERK